MPIFEVNAENGLSPLARGTQQNGEDFAQKLRFIPAGAGNTAVNAMIILRPAVYPRWRGEHVNPGDSVDYLIGLSPLARGTRGRHHHCRIYFRFIPAGAGNTESAFFLVSSRPVYPRWRGEHSTSPLVCATNCGLSPLARGTPLAVLRG